MSVQRHYAVEGRVEMKEVAACEPAVHADAAESGLRRRSRQECDDGGDNAGRAPIARTAQIGFERDALGHVVTVQMPEPAPYHQICASDCGTGMAGQLHGVSTAIGDHAALGGSEERRHRITQRDRGCFCEEAGKLHRALPGMIAQ